ncbi:hypothetical protein E3N88_44906 [Mikania micrantha]|uniref:Uncharacterized protein n=1 Tax=Mikania micrantha TaxID=192012 RepID=A0A5N6LD03_9ASTR|nr:hypothetical protein E3N88_44906 [Mikania micrantha]
MEKRRFWFKREVKRSPDEEIKANTSLTRKPDKGRTPMTQQYPLRSSGLSSPPDQDRAGPSEMQAASDTWKSRFSAFSTRYKESLSKSTRGWKDKLFNKGSSMSNIGSEVRGDMNTGIDNISHAIERLDVRENNRENHDDDDSSSNLAERVSDASESNQNLVETAGVKTLFPRIPRKARQLMALACEVSVKDFPLGCLKTRRLDDKERPNRQWLRPAECRGSWDSAAAGSEDSGEIREVDQSREIQM